MVRAADFPWHETGFRTPSFHDFVIYQLHVGAFHTPRFPQHSGTFLDVADKIPYLADVGVTAVQLLPIQEFPGGFSLGYHGTDYFSPEMAYEVDDRDLGPYLARVNALDQLGLDYLRARWRGVNSLENHDLVMQPKDRNDHNRMQRIARVADPSNPRSWYAGSRARVATGLLLTMPGIPMLFMGEEFLEDKQWSDDVSGHPELRLFWQGLDRPTR